jgi:RNA polymerase sigma factor (sigma-70 family)
MEFSEMVQGCINNDRKCQEMLYRTFSKKMFGVCIGYTKNNEQAKDVLQDGFVKVFKNISKINDETSLEGWIRSIMVNTSIDFYRKKKKELTFIDVVEIPDVVEDEALLENLQANKLLDLMNELPEGARLAFNLHVVEGYSHQTIATLLGVSESTSKSQCWRAKQLLRKMLLDTNLDFAKQVE